MGAINWAGVVPRAEDSGVRLDRCGFGWSMNPALNNFGTSFGSQFPACDSLGGVPPFPYAMGAGYIFSSALLRWVATDPKVVGWVEDARGGPEREALQWQKYEDTSTGYWLTYSPEPVEYVDIGAWVHDMVRPNPNPNMVSPNPKPKPNPNLALTLTLTSCAMSWARRSGSESGCTTRRATRASSRTISRMAARRSRGS